MKHGILITAYKKVDHLIRLIESLNDDKDFSFYIHIDKKSKISDDEILNLRNLNQVAVVVKKFNVNWGGYNHLKAFLFLAQEAIKDPQITYIHTITGQDFPVKSNREIKSFFDENEGSEYIESFPFPLEGWPGGGFDRIKYYNYYDKLNPSSKVQKWLISFLVSIQKVFKMERKIDRVCGKIYGGSTYWSLTRNFLSYVFDFIDRNPWFLKMFEHTFCAEEIFFQTIIMNSPFKNKVINCNLRYITWEYRNGSMPAILDSSDFEKIIDSKAIFARKLDFPISEPLFKQLQYRRLIT